MANFNEDFARCTECTHASFIPIESMQISKGSEYDHPVVIKRTIDYRCGNCGHIQYKMEKREA